MKVSNCCGAIFSEPGWPDNDICSACKEHADIDNKVGEYLRIKTSYGKGRLTDEEINRLGILGKSIKKSLSCDINDEGLPCRTDRLAAVGLMKKYISIHNERLND
jgi:hypothetical protein